MTFAIFCLLAVCALQTVFADNYNDVVANSKLECIHQIDDVQAKYASDLAAAADTVKIKDIKSDDLVIKCATSHYDKKLTRSVKDIADCDRCYNKAKTTEDIKAGKNCTKKLIGELKKAAKFGLPLVNECIAECAKNAASCRAVITYGHMKIINEIRDKSYDTNHV